MTDCATQLWSQLCLEASLTVYDSNKFLISLSAQSSSNADIRPPRCVPSTCIENIDMLFHFSTCRRTRDASRVPIPSNENGVQHALASTKSIDDHLDLHYHSSLSSLGRPQRLPDAIMDRCAAWTLGTSSVNTSPASSQDSISSNTYRIPSLDASTVRHSYAIQEVSTEILVQMMNSSLRRMMSDNKPSRPGGIVLSSDDGCPKLAAISAAMFSLGYVKVQPMIEVHDTADFLIPGAFAAYCATAHSSTHFVSNSWPHKFQPLEIQARAITLFIAWRLSGSWLKRGLQL